MSTRKNGGVERSVGAVVFRRTPSGIRYLLLHHPDKENRPGHRAKRGVSQAKLGHWDFPKGHIERVETSEVTLRREVKEETGISRLRVFPGLSAKGGPASGWKETIRYFVGPQGNKRLKFVAYFLAETKTRKVILSFEHQGYAWLPFKEAHRLVTYKNSKDVLRAANQFLKNKV